ncbi:MAG: hypothetical protein K6C10_03375 [Prevotella sp.]|nr:hypothetical protein [Prevotella sp.]
MKKVMMTLALLLTAVIMSAQTTGVKITPKYQKGDNMLYRTMGTTQVAGQVVNSVSENRYTVIDASADGYTIEVKTEKMDSDGQDFMARLLQMMEQAVKSGNVTYKTDADGKVISIVNFEEVKKSTGVYIEKMIDELMSEMPQAEAMFSKDDLKQQIAGTLTEENLIAQVTSFANPLALNGKTISTGAMDQGSDPNGRKLKNIYFLSAADGSKVKVTTALDMSKEEMKKMIIEQVKKSMPQQADMVIENIDQLMDSGMFNLNMNITSDYEFLPSGWAKSINLVMKQEMMGQGIESTQKIELVESNR